MEGKKDIATLKKELTKTHISVTHRYHNIYRLKRPRGQFYTISIVPLFHLPKVSKQLLQPTLTLPQNVNVTVLTVLFTDFLLDVNQSSPVQLLQNPGGGHISITEEEQQQQDRRKFLCLILDYCQIITNFIFTLDLSTCLLVACTYTILSHRTDF